ncbi:PucR family transcriptional regulator [Paeniglutamicibacter sp. NPDC012692]|uniref:PucR family transcriptional regulator n=1 Tax=Paeniglutamicibacter sp. NPDC012692 TaxID=3364388 RepID=UPI0036BCA58F
MNRKLMLGDMLAHPHNGGLRIVTGDPGTPLPEAVVESAEGRLPPHCAGDLAVLTIDPPSDAWQQDALIRRVRDRGFAALALPHADRFGAGSRILAGRLGLALLQVDRPMELAQAWWQLREGRDSLMLSYVRKAARCFEYHAEGVADLIAHLAANLGHGIALVTREGVLAQAGGALPAKLLAEIDFAPWLDTTRGATGCVASVRVDSPGRSGLRLAVFGQGFGEVQLGALAMAAEVMMPAVAARILIDEVAEVNEAAVSAGLLGDFLEKRPVPDLDLERRMLDRGWPISGYHLGFRMIGRTRIDSLQLLRELKRHLAGLSADWRAVTFGGGVAGWLNFPAPLTQNNLEARVAALRTIHAEVRRSFNIATGIGAPDSGPTGLVETINGASEAARIATQRSATGWFVRMDALGIEQLLLSWTESDTFIPAARALLGPLADNGAELVQTLGSYLDHESSITATATALNLHRNTVAARVSRVQELLGLDLSEPETRLALHLACRALAG